MLHDFVGGIQADVVRASLSEGGRIVWMPTLHSDYHSSIFGRGSFGIPSMEAPPEPENASSGTRVLDAKGLLSQETRHVIEVVAEYDGVLGTDHLSPCEIERVVSYSAYVGARVLVNHPFFLPREVDAEFFRRLTRHGAVLELCATVAFARARAGRAS